MGLDAVVGVLKVVDKVLSNPRVQGALTAPPLLPSPAINGQDQRLDVVIHELQKTNALLDELVQIQAAGLKLVAEQMRPAATMELLPEVAQQAAEAAGLDLAEHSAFEQRVADEVKTGGALRKRKV